MKQKRAFTLLEIMIVIFLIGLIGSVIGYNMKGSMEEGKAFKTKQAISQLEDIFELQMAQEFSADKILENPEACLKDSGLVKNPKSLLKDGWGKKFELEEVNGSIQITSNKYDEYREKKMFKNVEDED